MARTRIRPPRRWLASALAGVTCALLAFGVVGAAGLAAAPPASAAEAPSSEKTITAREQDEALDTAPMPDLAVTVSQTENLVAQGIRLSWTGGKKSKAPSGGNGGENFLQIFLCWGTDPDDPTRPDRTTCQYGGTEGFGATRDAYRNGTLADIPEADLPYTAPGVSLFPPFTSIPFIARDGTAVSNIRTDPATGAKTVDPSVNVNNNQFFTSYTTSEIPWAGSGNDGTGSVSFEVQTVVQSHALGCGAPIEESGATVGAGCWLVVLPRGSTDNGSTNITQSGLFADSWQHALAVELDFAPVGSRCPEGQQERRLSGSELASLAVSSWQPVVCNQEGGSVYSLITGAESDAVFQAVTSAEAPLALTSFPYRPEDPEAADPLAYAPIALTGVTVSVAIDRLPDPNDRTIPQEYRDAARSAFTTVNFTPRLLAKLLSYSYRSALPRGADLSYLRGTNPYNVTEDPDFLAVNDPEWAAQDLNGPAIADIIVPQGRSDAARAVWAYIAADADARDFLSGRPDPWGMIVNPYFSTDAATNPTGTAFTLERDDFPKADPIEVTPRNEGPINLITWRPYANDLDTVSYLTLRGDGLGLGGWDPMALPVPKFGKAPRSLPGEQRLLGLTSTASAARYQVVTASLRNSAGHFVAPSTAGMLASAAAMTVSSTQAATLAYDPQSDAARAASDAYPLSLPVYAASNPALTEKERRAAYAGFIRYAVSAPGQTLGVEVGQLPEGFAPLPSAWVASALAAADLIESGPPPSAGDGYIPPAASSPPVRTAPVAPAAVVPAADAPTADGTASGALSGAETPADPDTGALAAAIPASVLAGIAGAGAVPLITRLRRRVV